MTNIPTDLLRTLVAVVDHRSFTKAAMSLGVTQPAVSAQIKRLQFLLGEDIFDRSVQGVSLTAHGEVVVSYARRLLSINDQIVRLGGGSARPDLVVRIGTSSDFVAMVLPDILKRFRAASPAVRFNVSAADSDSMMRQLRNGELDLFIGLTPTEPKDARDSWAAPLVWVRGPQANIVQQGERVPLISNGEPSVHHRVAVSTLRAAGLEWEEVFTAPVVTSLTSAVTAGLGVMPITRRRAIEAGLIIADDLPLPPLPEVYAGVFVREGGPRDIYETLADDISATVRRLIKAPAAPKIGTAA
ncbi:MAG: LysR family transcriptional regulator [Proteobacteria bacterium]|nr:LysR family transcriptional regulator [Pseudomonadota bacterium]